MTSDESEFVKLMQNAFSAVKISFFNEMWRFANAKELDWERCLTALLAGGWVNPMHTSVPGPDGRRGFGGACLPKDLANLIQCMYDVGITGPGLSVCNAARVRNNQLDRKE
jgi:UDP-glucose 6-dehydrogenase